MNKNIAFFLLPFLHRHLFKKIFIFLVFFLILAHFLIFADFGDKCYANSESQFNYPAFKSDGFMLKYKNNSEILKVYLDEKVFKNLEKYELNQEIEYLEPNYIYNASIIPSDTYFENQWYLKKIKAPEAWNESREGANITIAIIDSGVQINHPDLKDNIWKNRNEVVGNGLDDDGNGFIDDINGWDFVNNSADPQPKFKGNFTQEGIIHGTIVAGIAAASGNNAAGIAGVAWQAKIMPIKVLDDRGEGDTINVVKAIDYAIANGADIINLSFVGFGYSQSLNSAIRRAYEKGVIIVAAAGNEQGQGTGNFLDKMPMYPVCHDGVNGENMVVGVAATDALDQKALFSGYGYKCIDVSAPGLSVFSTSVYSPSNNTAQINFSSYYDGYWSGTSMAVPMVSGAIALIEETNPGLTSDAVVELLKQNSDNINRLNPDYLGQLGSGRINIYRSVMAAKALTSSKEMKLIIAPYSNYSGLIEIADFDGKVKNEFFSYSENFRGGVNVASGDVDGDGQDEIITGAGFSGGPHVRIFDVSGNLKGQFFAYDKNFRGGVNVASGDVDGDGQDEIITGAGFSGGPHVRIFDVSGNLKGQFFAYDKNFRGGVNVASGDVDGDGQDEIITGAGFSGGPQVRIFQANGKIEGQFFAYDKNFRGGVNVAVVRSDRKVRNSQAKIVTAPGKGGGPYVIVFNNHAQILGQFLAYQEKFKGGVNISKVDVNLDGVDEIVTGAGPGGSPHVRIFQLDGSLVESFYALNENFDGGVSVGSISIN